MVSATEFKAKCVAVPNETQEAPPALAGGRRGSSRQVIAGQGLINGEVHAFLATPIHHPHVSGEDLAPAPQGKATPAALSEDTRKRLQQRSLSGRPR